TQQWQIALAATGKTKYHLLNRIERIMKTKKPIGNARHILLALVILTASITGLAWLNPTIAHGKLSFNKIKPAILAELLSDTTHKKAAKTTHKTYTAKKSLKAAGKHGNLYYSDNDPVLRKYSDEMSKYGEAMEKYYNSPEWKKYQEQMEMDGKKMEEYYSSPEWKKTQDAIEPQGKKIEEYYNSPQWKELTEKQQKLSEDFQKNWGETAETEEWGSKMGELGRKIEHYYGSPEFKRLNEQLETKYGIPHNRKYSSDDDRKSENYRKYEAELNQHTPADVRQATEEMKILGEKMRGHWDSPEFHAQSEELRHMGDSIRHMSDNGSVKEMQAHIREMSTKMRDYQNNPEMKKLQQDMRSMGSKMREYQNSPEMKRLQHEMKAMGEKMRAYTNSPEFKERMKRMQKDGNFNYNFNF